MKETRSIQTKFETAEGNRLVGYAAVWDSPTVISERGRTFTEVVRRGTFTRAIQEQQDVIAVLNHDDNRLLGRTASGTLKLAEDAHGLRFELELDPTEANLIALIGRGDLRGASFSFVTKRDKWSDPSTRELLDVDLQDVSVVVRPAYQATSLALRSRNAKRRIELLRKMLPDE